MSKVCFVFTKICFYQSLAWKGVKMQLMPNRLLSLLLFQIMYLIILVDSRSYTQFDLLLSCPHAPLLQQPTISYWEHDLFFSTNRPFLLSTTISDANFNILSQSYEMSVIS